MHLTVRPVLKYMNVASAERKHLIYRFKITIYKKKILLIYGRTFTQSASACDLKAFQIKCGLITINY